MSNDIPLERVVIQQHRRLKAMRVQENQIASILDGSTQSRVLLLLDGYDEYKRGGSRGFYILCQIDFIRGKKA